MIEEMLAGDELAPDDPATVRATGFLVRNWDIFNRNAWLASTVEHTARAFLGVTIQCARCHDHKFDPISQADYYRFRAFFEPYHIRIDRVPGQPDRTKAGLPRAFDDFLETPTYLFVRGDETTPDKIAAAPSGDSRRSWAARSRSSPSCSPTAPPAPTSESSSSARRSRRRTRRSRRPKPPPLTRREIGPSKRTRLSPPPERPTARPRQQSKRRSEHAGRAQGGAGDGRRGGRGAGALPSEPRWPLTKIWTSRRSAVSLAEARRSALERGPVRGMARRPGSQDERFRGLGQGRPRRARRPATGLRSIEAAFNRVSASRDLNRARNNLDGLLAAGRESERRSAQGRPRESRGCARRGARPTRRRRTAVRQSRGRRESSHSPRSTPRARSSFPAQDDLSRHPEQRPLPKGQHRPAARAGPLDRRPPQPADGRVAVNHVWARHFGEPLVALDVRLRPEDAPARTPCAPRLAGRRVHGKRAGASSICTG